METKKIKLDGVEAYITMGQDGVPVVYIDTPNIEDGRNGPKIRIRLNDEKIWDDKNGLFGV